MEFSPKELAEKMYAAFIEKSGDTYQSSMQWIRDERLSDPKNSVISYFKNSYIKRKLMYHFLHLTGFKNHYDELSIKHQKTVRTKLYSLAIEDFEKVLSKPAVIPDHEIEKAIALLNKAGYLVYNSSNKIKVLVIVDQGLIETVEIENTTDHQIVVAILDVDKDAEEEESLSRPIVVEVVSIVAENKDHADELTLYGF